MTHPVKLEQCLSEGAYNKIVAGREDAPAAEYLPFMNILVDTVRDEVADCCERAYAEMEVGAAQAMLFCADASELHELVAERVDEEVSWSIEGSLLKFNKAPKSKVQVRRTRPAPPAACCVLLC